ncbi:MAG TPA: hypothetical protein DCY19_09660 [Eubacterium sp.]|jgi:hypothetical protein|nr:hypothetical protein [Eubacterium sp.]
MQTFVHLDAYGSIKNLCWKELNIYLLMNIVIAGYIHLEKYDKAVMAALILKAEVVDENRLNVVWKHQDIYEKIFSIL